MQKQHADSNLAGMTGTAQPPQARGSKADVRRVHFIASTSMADQVACGAAAGVAAAFNAPVGGMLYLMELCTRWRLELTWRTFFSTSITVLALQLILKGCEASHTCESVRAFLSVSGRSAKYKFSQPYAQLPYIVLLAVLCGMLGAAWVSANARIVKLRRRWGTNKPLLFLEVGALTSDGSYYDSALHVIVVVHRLCNGSTFCLACDACQDQALK